MTVMFSRFFGVPQAAVREGFWSKMKPSEMRLYIYIMFESERCCRRELTRTDAQVRASVGAAPRTLCNARKKLAELGLIQCRRGDGNKFMYTICDPVTRAPYSGSSKARPAFSKRSDDPVKASKEQTKVNGIPAVEIFQ